MAASSSAIELPGRRNTLSEKNTNKNSMTCGGPNSCSNSLPGLPSSSLKRLLSSLFLGDAGIAVRGISSRTHPISSGRYSVWRLKMAPSKQTTTGKTQRFAATDLAAVGSGHVLRALYFLVQNVGELTHTSHRGRCEQYLAGRRVLPASWPPSRATTASVIHHMLSPPEQRTWVSATVSTENRLDLGKG